ncbi:hypothetical protein L228DRAFT_263924 [Xylona heveae TC161]|uniref:Zn(2)-C6 fungal-type domain-containing protein n=1 Tax=Xylona heveae (strain CBS 132557 / TC161) TaxID=1328760 RepID=A0A164ZJ21_XYLHT|nr:hypothetical protein L228DRAFT_263924 [Xylona heveae TC161]KZF19158.1 hypothetical protein L228DRAFT_263924 [Xylona heveae TC161]
MSGVRKSRNGCTRCKDKRLKCDERKPACDRCVRRGLTCPGYVQPLRWSTKYEIFSPNKRGNSSRSLDTKPKPVSATRAVEENSPISQLSGTASEDRDEMSTIGIEDWPVIGSSLEDESLEFDSSLDFDFDPILSHFLNGPESLPPNQMFEDLHSRPDPSPSQPLGGSVLREAFSPLVPVSTPRTEIEDHLPPTKHDQHDQSVVLSRPHQLDEFQKSPASDHTVMTFPIDRSLTPTSLMLIEYYFKEVAAIFSCYDSQMNPFRTTVSRMWNSSPSMYHAMQSMAAACLADDFPQLNGIGVQLRREAAASLQTELNAPNVDNKSLLALIMLGQTASWHNPKDLGIAEFNQAKQIINSMLSKRYSGQSGGDSRNLQFFSESIIYWEMLLSYVTESDQLGLPASEISRADTLTPNFVPHPWTGIAREAQLTVYEIGKLIRGERMRVRMRKFTSRADIEQIQQAISIAQTLEERLLTMTCPAENAVINPKDDRTPVRHLLDIAEVYRCIGLLQLYRVFPDLLSRRLQTGAPSPDFGASMNGLAMHMSQKSGSTGTDVDTDYQDEESVMDTWLTQLAMYSLNLLKSIPLESRTKCVQPFLLVAAASELRLSSASLSPGVVVQSPDNISLQTVSIVRTRNFITSRLTSFLHFLPPKPIHVLLKLVRETWARMDSGDRNVYWMDIMIENGWETTMG